MSLRNLLGRLFGGKQQEKSASSAPSPGVPSGAEDYAARREKLLAAYPHRELPRSMKADEIVAEWERAHAQAGVPVLLLADEHLVDALESGEWQDAPLPDLNELFAPVIEELVGDEESESMIGRMGEESGEAVLPLASLQNADPAPLYLAQIPVEKPWDIFKCLPIGGWNACPDAPVFVAFCKEMNEKYGAEPLLIGGDCIEMKVARRPVSAGEAYSLALEFYAFDEDVLQMYGTIWMLADSLMKSDYWYFWWD